MAIESTANIPAHVGIIMDGNGRWAQQRGLPRSAGHIAGVENVRNIIRASKDFGVRYLTLFAFSTENWKRPLDEISFLMKLLIDYMRRELNDLNKEGAHVNVIGDMSGLPKEVQDALNQAIELTHGNDTIFVNFALNYGSRSEITRAVKSIAKDVASGALSEDSITSETISERLYTAGQPDPDLIIRTSGEMRISNFMLFQSAYAEYYFSELLWPDFLHDKYKNALDEYSNRSRRFGGVK